MMRIRLGLLHTDERGLTLVELMIAIVLAGIVTAGITMTFAHLLAGSTRTSNHMTAVRQVQSAGYWVSRDALQAQQWTISDSESTDPSEYPKDSGFPFTLEWEWAGNRTEVTYSITADNMLLRTTVVTENGEDKPPVSSYVAQHMDVTLDDDLKPNTRFIHGDVLTLRVTATVGAGSVYERTETRVYEVKPRPG